MLILRIGFVGGVLCGVVVDRDLFINLTTIITGSVQTHLRGCTGYESILWFGLFNILEPGCYLFQDLIMVCVVTINCCGHA